jgi:hypothetical protein
MVGDSLEGGDPDARTSWPNNVAADTNRKLKPHTKRDLQHTDEIGCDCVRQAMLISATVCDNLERDYERLCATMCH